MRSERGNKRCLYILHALNHQSSNRSSSEKETELSHQTQKYVRKASTVANCKTSRIHIQHPLTHGLPPARVITGMSYLQSRVDLADPAVYSGAAETPTVCGFQ